MPRWAQPPTDIPVIAISPKPHASALKVSTPAPMPTNATRVLVLALGGLPAALAALPACVDVRKAFAATGVHISFLCQSDWTSLIKHSAGVDALVACDVDQWRANVLAAQTQSAWAQFKAELNGTPDFAGFDHVIDFTGSTNAAAVLALAPLSSQGQRVCTTDTAWPVKLLCKQKIKVDTSQGTLQAHRDLAALALGYTPPAVPADAGLFQGQRRGNLAGAPKALCLAACDVNQSVWSEDQWLALGKAAKAKGFNVVIPHRNEAEMTWAKRLASQISRATVWPRMSLHMLAQAMRDSDACVSADDNWLAIAQAVGVPALNAAVHPDAAKAFADWWR
jgi:heptosyltransferase I